MMYSLALVLRGSSRDFGYLWVGFDDCLSSCPVWFFGVGPEEVRSRVRCSMAGALPLGSDQVFWGSYGCNDSRGHDSS